MILEKNRIYIFFLLLWVNIRLDRDSLAFEGKLVKFLKILNSNKQFFEWELTSCHIFCCAHLWGNYIKISYFRIEL